MKVTIFVNGQEFSSKEDESADISAKDLAEQIYQMIDSANKFKLETDKGFIVLGETALKSCVMLISD